MCLLRSTDLVHQSQNDFGGPCRLASNGFLVTRIRVIYMSSIFPLADDRSPGIVFVLLFKICGAILWYYTQASEDR